MTAKKRKLKTRFEKSLSEVVKYYEQYDSFPKEIYHYTNKNGLCGIINSGELLLTNYQNYLPSSDPLELQLLNNYLQKIDETHLVDKTFKAYMRYHKMDCYIFSFCEDFENPYLWTKYAKENNVAKAGYVLGFKDSLFEMPEKTYENYFSYAFLKIDYIDKFKPNMNISKCIDAFFHYFRVIYNARNIDKIDEVSTDFFRIAYSNIPRYKSKNFEDEKEHRLCAMNTIPPSPIPNTFKTKDGRFIYNNKIRENLACIILGPLATLNELEIRNLLIISNETALKNELLPSLFNINKISIRRLEK